MAHESRGGLGRGLGALLGAAPTVSASRGGGTLPLSLMQSGALQPRREIHREPLEELAASIKAKGDSTDHRAPAAGGGVWDRPLRNCCRRGGPADREASRPSRSTGTSSAPTRQER